MSDSNQVSEFSFNTLIAKVKALEPELTPLVAITKEEQTLYCSHNHAEIDEKKRTFSCQKCGVELNQFDFILQLAKEERRFLNKNKELFEMQKTLVQSVDAIQKKVYAMRSAYKQVKADLKALNAELTSRAMLLGKAEMLPTEKTQSKTMSVCLSAAKELLKK